MIRQEYNDNDNFDHKMVNNQTIKDLDTLRKNLE